MNQLAIDCTYIKHDHINARIVDLSFSVSDFAKYKVKAPKCDTYPRSLDIEGA